jgi:hypothetical protein
MISSARTSSVGGMIKPQGLGGLEVDDQFEFGGLLNWEISRLSGHAVAPPSMPMNSRRLMGCPSG